jgi:hypothetical protein
LAPNDRPGVSPSITSVEMPPALAAGAHHHDVEIALAGAGR